MVVDDCVLQQPLYDLSSLAGDENVGPKYRYKIGLYVNQGR